MQEDVQIVADWRIARTAEDPYRSFDFPNYPLQTSYWLLPMVNRQCDEKYRPSRQTHCTPVWDHQ